MYANTLELIEKNMPQVYPGAVVRFLRKGTQETYVFGQASMLPTEEKMTATHVFDTASLTKVICTTTVLLKCWDQGMIDMDDSLQYWLPEYKDPSVKIKHLLTLTAAIHTWIPHRDQLSAEELKAAYLTLASDGSAGQRVHYTDTGFILLGFLLEKLFQKPLTEIFCAQVLVPLGMTNSGFPPFSKAQSSMIVPTQQQANGQVLRGVTHDPKARILGPHAGNAGLFSTVDDVTAFVQTLFEAASHESPFFSKRIIEALKQPQTTGDRLRTYGWDLIGPTQQLFHTGYTGTFMLVDLKEQQAFIFLSNRVHPQDHRAAYITHRDEIVASYLKESQT